MKVYPITLLGHKDHGKSTLIGSLLMQTGAATQARIKEAEEYSRRLKKDFEPAFILDSFAEERTGEMTIDTTRAEIAYKGAAFVLIDVPGHEELIKNMISGASYGETAILLVSAKEGEGIRPQTKRHLYIARMLGIDTLIVAVNKMDLIHYDKEKFDEIRNGLLKFIEKIGFKDSKVHFVPISAYRGENLVKNSKNIKWYDKGSLLDVIYSSIKKVEKTNHGPLRIIAQGSIVGDGKNVVVGRVINGSIKIGEKVCFLPSSVDAIVKDMVVKGKKVKMAWVGDNVAMTFKNKIKAEVRGSVISSYENRPSLEDVIIARIFVAGKFGKGLQIKFNGVDIKCKGIKFLRRIDPTTGESSDAKGIKLLDAADAEVTLVKKIPIEDYNMTKELGRFVLYNGNEFSGIGIIEK